MRALSATAAVVAAVLLTGCFQQLPGQVVITQPATAPPAPTDPAPPQPTAPQPTDPQPADVPTGTWGPITVDDGAGDISTYTVEGVAVDVPHTEGEVPEGHHVVALVLSASHDEGEASWMTCFDVALVSYTDTDVYTYTVDTSVAVGADTLTGQDQSFWVGLAPVVVPIGTSLDHWVISSRYGDDVQNITL